MHREKKQARRTWKKMLTSLPFTIANYPVTGHADRNRCQRESELPCENSADTRTRGNYFKYITKFKSPLNHNARDSNARFTELTRDERKKGEGKKKKEKPSESDKLNFRYACLIISHGCATV